MAKVKGARRKALKKNWQRMKNIERNNLPKGQHFTIVSLRDLMVFDTKRKINSKKRK